MATVSSGYVNQQQLATEIEQAIAKLGPGVVHVKYTVENDWSGEPAIYFRVTLTDEVCSNDKTLDEVAERVTRTLFDGLRPLENWGLMAYFNFRSFSEQAAMSDPAWA